MNRWWLIIMLVIAPMFSYAETPCTQKEAVSAETEASILRTWGSVYQSFLNYGHCDDGAIAEGYSWSVMKLLTEHWKSITELAPLWKNHGFATFVKRHIGETYSHEETQHILNNATTHCPAEQHALCEELKQVATSTPGAH